MEGEVENINAHQDDVPTALLFIFALIRSVLYYNLNMPMLELREPDRRTLAERKAVLLEKAKRACEYLRDLGAGEVYLFGSITRDDFHPHSDVDIAVVRPPFHTYLFG